MAVRVGSQTLRAGQIPARGDRGILHAGFGRRWL